MKQYKTPYIEVLLFDEEDIVTTSAYNGYTATQANTYQMGEDAGMGSGSNVKISTVKVTELNMD